jgi:nickel/cobalt transporter (NicO) family protein
MKRDRLISILFVLALCLAQVSPATAHPADIYLQSIDVVLTDDGLSIAWELSPGPMLVSYVWFEADDNKDEQVSAEEAERWAGERVPLLAVTLNGERLPLQLDSLEFPASRSEFQSGSERIKVYLSAAWTRDSDEPDELVFHNRLEEQNSLNWYSVIAQDEIRFQTPSQKNNILTLYLFDPSAQDAAQTPLATEWDSSMPSLPGQPTEIPTQPAEASGVTEFIPSEEKSSQDILLDLVRREEFSIPFYIFALGISLLLGSLHALTPGHGKTVVAAYLVGSRGTVWHAMALGTVVTLTHTGSVFLLGIVTLLASQYILPTTLIPIMEILSGLLILGLGLYLLWQRYQHWRRTKPTAPAGPSPTFSLKPATGKIPSGRLQIQKTHAAYGHSHGHAPAPSGADWHAHGDGRVHSHEVPEAITWRSLVALGVSGGLVPCPDAIAILLVAIAINRILLGLALIVSFSFGLAVVLIVIGLLMVNSRRLFDRVSIFEKYASVLPMVSALVVLALGAALTVGAYDRAKDAFNFVGVGLGSMKEAQVIYLAGGQEEVKQLFVADIQSVNPVLLSDAKENVTEHVLSPDRMNVIYITQSENLENKIWLADVESGERSILSNCRNAICSRPAWSPDGTRVVYEFTRLSGEDLTGLTTLRWVDVGTGESKPVFQGENLPGSNPRWSPDGKWLSYAISGELRLYHLETGESHAIRNAITSAVEWSPDSRKVLYRDVILQGRQFITQLFVYDLVSRTASQINPDASYENLSAVWSPDGEWIAAVRRELSITRGDQVWVMRADGSEARMLTNTPDALHNNLTWSPDGKYLLYDVFLPNSPSLESDIQVIEVESGAVNNLGIKGYQAEWRLP